MLRNVIHLSDFFVLVNHQLKLTTAKPSAKSVFVKKAAILQSDKNFKFNFEVKPEDQTANEISKLSLGTLPNIETTKEFHFLPSSNAFRFNFSENA